MNNLKKTLIQVVSALFYSGYVGAYDDLTASAEEHVRPLKKELHHESFSNSEEDIAEFYLRYTQASDGEKKHIYKQLVAEDSPLLNAFEPDIPEPSWQG